MKQVIVDQIEVPSSDVLHVRMKKQIVDGVDTYDIGYHRMTFYPGQNFDDQITLLNGSLASLGFDPLSQFDTDRIKRISLAVPATE